MADGDMDTVAAKEIINAIAFSRICFYNCEVMLQAYQRAGLATALMDNRRDIRAVIPDATPRFIEQFANADDALHRAESEYEWDLANNVEPLTFNDSRYPERLKHCADAPIVLFYKGSADLNQRRIISIVGTRHCTTYGQDLIRRFITELRQLCPQVLVVSGLAYGVDINAHRQALDNGYETVAVLAHGLDYIYPPHHKPTADRMVGQGGLLTEFVTLTNADKMNFVRRNRIVAGMADSTILVESAAHGGGLITTRLASDYDRDVFAFPGAVGAPYSEGCNNLIRDHSADLITSAQDFVNAMCWNDDSALVKAQKKGIERQMFPQLTTEEDIIVKALQQNGDMQTNILAVRTGIPIGQLAAHLFSLEMKGVLKSFAGGTYHLIN